MYKPEQISFNYGYYTLTPIRLSDLHHHLLHVTIP